MALDVTKIRRVGYSSGNEPGMVVVETSDPWDVIEGTDRYNARLVDSADPTPSKAINSLTPQEAADRFRPGKDFVRDDSAADSSTAGKYRGYFALANVGGPILREGDLVEVSRVNGDGTPVPVTLVTDAAVTDASVDADAINNASNCRKYKVLSAGQNDTPSGTGAGTGPVEVEVLVVRQSL